LVVYTLLPHYASPLTALLFGLIVQGVRYVRVFRWRGQPVGPSLVRALPAACLLMVAIRVAAGPLGVTLHEGLFAWYDPVSAGLDRSKLIDNLQAQGGKHLIVVRYAPAHNPDNEWVYNNADIDGSPVVWAREMGAGDDRELLAYFKDRKAWLLEPDRQPPRLTSFALSP
jgi:hypothetical protein